MLCVRRKLQARVPDLLAAISAVLLMATLIAGTGDSMFAARTSSDRYAAAVEEPTEVPQEALSNPQTNMRKGFKISLMFFH
jgi:hypothetical protein